MNSPTPASRGGVARVCRYLYRVPLLLVHLLLFLPMLLIAMLPPWGVMRVGTVRSSTSRSMHGPAA